MSTSFGFDTFLGNLPQMPSSGVAVPLSVTAPPSAGTAITGVGQSSVPAVSAQPIDIVMATLKSGPRTIRDLVPLVGSPGLAVQTVEKLSLLGYAEHQVGDYFTLTTSGQEAAAALTYPQP